VADGLFAPYGVALTDDAAYVTTCAVCVGGGEVIKIPLDRSGRRPTRSGRRPGIQLTEFVTAGATGPLVRRHFALTPPRLLHA
jgi:hypothetical protein